MKNSNTEIAILHGKIFNLCLLYESAERGDFIDKTGIIENAKQEIFQYIKGLEIKKKIK